eukprot:516498-Pyramimonas_sp.AAC.1
MGCGAAVGSVGAGGLTLSLTLLAPSPGPCGSVEVRVRPLPGLLCTGAVGWDSHIVTRDWELSSVGLA